MDVHAPQQGAAQAWGQHQAGHAAYTAAGPQDKEREQQLVERFTDIIRSLQTEIAKQNVTIAKLQADLLASSKTQGFPGAPMQQQQGMPAADAARARECLATLAGIVEKNSSGSN